MVQYLPYDLCLFSFFILDLKRILTGLLNDKGITLLSGDGFTGKEIFGYVRYDLI